jgi:hypothetical protein
MGLELTVRFPTGHVPSWDDIRTRLAHVGESVSLRMIDGMPAFPDESPDANWRELRLGFTAGMVTLRRAHSSLSCVTWGNADAALLSARDRVAWACAAAGGGAVESSEGAVSADEFALKSGISPV